MWLLDKLAKSSVSADVEALQKQKSALEAEIEALETKNAELKRLGSTLSAQVDNYFGEIEAYDIGLQYISHPVSTYEAEISRLQTKLGKIAKQENAVKIVRQYTVDGSISKGKRFQNNYTKILLTSFNTTFEKKCKTVKWDTLASGIETLDRRWAALNKQANMLGFQITDEYLNIAHEILKCFAGLKEAKQEEKERLREERRLLKEQEQLLKEAEKERLELQKERRMYEQSLSRAITEEEKQEFEEKLKEIDKREADVDYRINNKRAGYLYITSTPAMPGMVKIGCTRRLNPLQRIAELSSASVPYPFKCHGVVFSDDVFTLEKSMHDYFKEQRVNKNNLHKEFFYIAPQQAIDILQDEYHETVHFIDTEVNDEGEEED